MKLSGTYHKLTQHELDDLFVHACKQGDLEKVCYLLVSPQLTRHAQINCHEGKALAYACAAGHEEIVHYLLTSPELQDDKADLHLSNEWALRMACSNGHLDLVKYLLQSPQIKQGHARVAAVNGPTFVELCRKGYLAMLEYLLSFEDENGCTLVDIHFNEEEGLLWACRMGHLPVVEYLLTSPQLSTHAFVHACDDLALHYACLNGHLEVVKYLLNHMMKSVVNHPTRIPDDPALMLEAISWACKNGHLHVVKYLLDYAKQTNTDFTTDLTKHFSSDEFNKSLLNIACQYGQIEILDFLIFEHNIIISPMEELSPTIKKLFTIREIERDSVASLTAA